VGEVVLDASAALALLFDEPGADMVQEALGGGAIMSSVNVAEVVGKIAERDRLGGPKTLRAIEDLGVAIVPFDSNQALIAGVLRWLTKEKGLSLGDRACLALGKVRNAPVLTADAIWKEIEEAVRLQVVLIR